MKILHVITSTGIGGAQVMLRRYLADPTAWHLRHEVVSVLPGGRIGVELAEMGVPVVDLGMTSAAQAPFALGRLRRIVAERSPDLVHGWMYHGSLAAALAAPAAMPRILGMHHSLADRRTESLSTRLILRGLARLSARSAAVTYCGHAIAEQHEAIGFAASRRAVIPNGTDHTAFLPCPEARARLGQELGLPETRIVIGNVTRNHPMKDVGMLVRAAKRLLDDGLDVQVVVMGEGHEDGPARKEAQRLGIENRVTLLPARADVAPIVAGFDIFVLCSAWGEAFSLALSEAMAAGVPGVATDVGDSAWLIGDRARIVPPRDDAALARVLAELSRATPAHRRSLGARDRTRIIENFSMSSYVEAHAALYEAAMMGEARLIAAQ